MTEGQVSRLKPGDRVEAKKGRKWYICTVEQVKKSIRNYTGRLVHQIYTRRVGRTGKGNLFPVGWGLCSDVRLLPDCDVITGNVFADFLEEHGYQEAAQALRQAFPIADGK